MNGSCVNLKSGTDSMRGMLLILVVMAMVGATASAAGSALNVRLSAGVGALDSAPFVEVGLDYTISLGSLVLAPGVGGTVFVFSGVVPEVNGYLSGTYALNDWLGAEFLVGRGLGTVGEAYCHQVWRVGLAAQFGATNIGVAKGANARTVWGCGNDFQDTTTVSLTHELSARHSVGVLLTIPGEARVSLGWRF